MSEHPAFAEAAQGARKAAARQGLTINWMRWEEKTGHLEWTGIPKRQAKAAAEEPPAFLMPESMRRHRGLAPKASQGQLL